MEQLSKMEQELGIPTVNCRKRARNKSPASDVSSAQRKRIRADAVLRDTQYPSFPNSYMPSPESSVSSPDTTCESRFSSMPYDSQAESIHTSFLDFPPNTKSGNAEFPTLDCGFCSVLMPCVCREIALEATGPTAPAEHKMEHMEVNRIISVGTPPPEPSVLDNLPLFQPAVPLPRRSTGARYNSIFPVEPLPSDSPANCSGDPNNCEACADDSFGKEFCAAIGRSVAAMGPCDDCPGRQDTASVVDSSPSGTSGTHLPLSQPTPTPGFPSPSFIPSQSETIPTNDAWRQLKSHPNVAFADLALLADVVARRSKCSGPRVIISPSPGSITPERAVSPEVKDTAMDDQPVLLTDPHAHFHAKFKQRASAKGGSPPRLVPEEVLLRCGQHRVQHVNTVAVRDALRLLDARFSLS